MNNGLFSDAGKIPDMRDVLIMSVGGPVKTMTDCFSIFVGRRLGTQDLSLDKN